jgi:hypothetical protein
VDVLDAVWPGRELRDVARRGQAVRSQIGAAIDVDPAANAEDDTIGRAGDFKIAVHFAGMVHRHKMFAAILVPFHRPPHQAGRKRDQEVFRIKFAASAEAAADIVLDQLNRSFLDAEHRRQGAAIEE